MLSIQTGHLPPGKSTCLGLTLQRGEFIRISIDTDAGFLRARILSPGHNPLQVTWIWSFFPSLPLVIEAPESGLYVVELSVPSRVPFKEVPTYKVQMLDRQPAAARAAHGKNVRRDSRVAWLRDFAQRVRSIAPSDTDFGDLEFLREVLHGTRVVLLGEGDHGGGSDVLAKTRLTKFLHERMGFDVVAFEAGIHSTTAAWRALQTESDPRDALLKGVFGILGRSAQAESLIQYLFARARTVRPLEVAGFDSQFTGTAAKTLLPELQEFLSKRGISSPFTDSQAMPTRALAGTIEGQFAQDRSTLPSLAEQAQAVEALHATALEIERRAPDREGAFWAQVLRSTAVQIALLLDNLRSNSNREYVSGRDRQMAENLNWLVNTRYTGRKVIVWAHTSHVMRNPETTSHGRVAGYSMGHGVWQALGNESFAIGLTSYNGTTHWLTQPDGYDQDVIPGQHSLSEFETMMDAAGHQMAFVNLRAARARGDWLGGRFVASALYLMPEEAEWSKALDALFFIRTQEPRRRAR
ncbi:MAG: erythromycin esterase family protein [Acidobacteria bacterium]|nr:erythromycin esterase family protein [Acidobacteriota bacterium]